MRRKRLCKRVGVINYARSFAKAHKGKAYMVKGKPSLTGFKPPRKVWDEKATAD